jgi:hypothetical protein
MNDEQKSTVLAALGQKFIELSRMTPKEREAEVNSLFHQLARAGINKLQEAQSEAILKTLRFPVRRRPPAD